MLTARGFHLKEREYGLCVVPQLVLGYSLKNARATMIRILLVFMLAAIGAASAQTTGALAPSSDNAAPGDCMPIGVTASGEVVFPITCHAFLEQRRGPIDKPIGASADKAESRPPPAPHILPSQEKAALLFDPLRQRRHPTLITNSRPTLQKNEHAAQAGVYRDGPVTLSSAEAIGGAHGQVAYLYCGSRRGLFI